MMSNMNIILYNIFILEYVLVLVLGRLYYRNRIILYPIKKIIIIINNRYIFVIANYNKSRVVS